MVPACQFVFYFSAGTRYTVVGYKLAGLLGAIVAIIATIIPPFVIITVISYFYELFRDNFIVSKLLSGHAGGRGRGDRFRRVGHGRRRCEAEKRCFLILLWSRHFSPRACFA